MLSEVPLRCKCAPHRCSSPLTLLQLLWEEGGLAGAGVRPWGHSGRQKPRTRVRAGVNSWKLEPRVKLEIKNWIPELKVKPELIIRSWTEGQTRGQELEEAG